MSEMRWYQGCWVPYGWYAACPDNRPPLTSKGLQQEANAQLRARILNRFKEAKELQTRIEESSRILINEIESIEENLKATVEAYESIQGYRNSLKK